MSTAAIMTIGRHRTVRNARKFFYNVTSVPFLDDANSGTSQRRSTNVAFLSRNSLSLIFFFFLKNLNTYIRIRIGYPRENVYFIYFFKGVPFSKFWVDTTFPQIFLYEISEVSFDKICFFFFL